MKFKTGDKVKINNKYPDATCHGWVGIIIGEVHNNLSSEPLLTVIVNSKEVLLYQYELTKINPDWNEECL